MTAHIEMPALDPSKGIPTTLSRPIVTGVLRDGIGFRGLIYTDSMGMQGVTAQFSPGEAAVRAVKAGNDVVLHSPDDVAAFQGIKSAVEKGEIPLAQINASVERILRAKAIAGLHKTKLVNLDGVATSVGSRAHKAVARDVSQRSMTLIKDERNSVPLTASRDGAVLYLSVLDYPSGWRIAAPSRSFIPALRERWPNVTAIELSDRTTAVGDRARAVDGAALRRDRRVGLRADGIVQRTHGSRAAARAAAAGPGARRRRARGSRTWRCCSAIRTRRRFCRSCRRCC